MSLLRTHACELRMRVGRASGSSVCLGRSVTARRPAVHQPGVHQLKKRCASCRVAAAEPVVSNEDNQSDAVAFDWHDQWYPVGFERDFSKELPTAYTLLGEPVVIWWDPVASTWAAHADRCPHRLVPLSEGRVTAEGQLQCAYHGWEFARDGQCTAIPQGGKKATPRACTTVYNCVAAEDLIWVKPKALPRNADLSMTQPPVDLSELPIPEEWRVDPQLWITQDSFRDIPLAFDTVLENVLDIAHVPFTHHKTISNRSRASEMMDVEVTGEQPNGFTGIWHGGPANGKWGPQTSRFVAPCYVKHCVGLDNFADTGFGATTVVYAVPLSRGETRLISRVPIKVKAAPLRAVISALPRWMVHQNQLVALEDDQIFLHKGELEFAHARDTGKPLGQLWYTPNQQDVFTHKFRRWLDSAGGGGPWGPTAAADLLRAAPRQGRDALLERYHQHVEKCETCKRALARFRIARRVARAAAGALLVFAMATMNRAIGLVVGAAGAYSLSYVFTRIIGKFYQGSWPPPRNID